MSGSPEKTVFKTFEDWITDAENWNNDALDLIDAWNARQPEIDALQAENEVLRSLVERIATTAELAALPPTTGHGAKSVLTAIAIDARAALSESSR